MKSSFNLVLMAGALALATATPAAMAATGDDAASAGSQGTIDYKTEYNKCSQLPGSDTAGCKDAVGMREADPASRTAPASLEGVGTSKAQDKCANLTGDAKRECLINDNAGG